MKELSELILILSFTTYFFGFPVDINKLLESKVVTINTTDCPKEEKQEKKSDDSPKTGW